MADFFKTKKKKAGKPATNLNLNAQPEKDPIQLAAEAKWAAAEAQAAEEAAQLDAVLGAAGAKKREDDVKEPGSPSKGPSKAMDLWAAKAEEARLAERERVKRQWDAPKVKQEVLVSGYTSTWANPGQITAHKYPELNPDSNITVGFEGKKAKVTEATNAFAKLDVDGDVSDEDEEKLVIISQAKVSKKKGENINVALEKEKAKAREITGATEEAELLNGKEQLTDRQQKEIDEKNRLKAEKKAEAERKRLVVRENMKAIKKEGDAPVEAVDPSFNKCDFSKFSYVTYDSIAAAEKYEERVKLVEAN